MFTTRFQAWVRRNAQRIARLIGRLPITPNQVTIAGTLFTFVAAVLAGLGQLRPAGVVLALSGTFDILDGALARATKRSYPYGAFLDSTFDRLGEAAMLTAIGLVFARDGNDVALVATFAAVIGSFLVSYTRAKAEALGLRGDVGIGSRAERVIVITAGLVLAPWGVLPWALTLLACTAWVTVAQRVLYVRKQLMEAQQ